MKRFYSLALAVFFLHTVNLHAQNFIRSDSLTIQKSDLGGWGNCVAGVDLDKDGKPEIYTINSNAVDDPESLTPRIYKWELEGNKYQMVWNAELTDIIQNTWPALCVGDVDNDGIQELLWAPANWVDTTYKNPDRIIVYKPIEGTEALGVDFFGSYLPNAKFKITTEDNTDLRVFKMAVSDFDKDGKNELFFVDRNGNNSQWHFGMITVDKIPVLGDNTETWTIKVSGKTPGINVGTAAKWDFAQLGNIIYLMDGNGKVWPLKLENGTWKSLPVLSNIAEEESANKSMTVVDLNNDGTKEIVIGGWYGAKAFLLQQQGDTLTSTKIADFSNIGLKRINGGDCGDVDGDGKLDFVYGSRQGYTSSVGAIVRMAYKGGAITDSNNYAISMIDSLYHKTTGQMDVISIGNLDGDAAMEIAYSSGYPRGPEDHPAIPIVILDTKFTATGVESNNKLVPAAYYLSQNYPNPFNPTTSIAFGLPQQTAVSLKIYNTLGQEVGILLNNRILQAGAHTVTFEAGNLSSGTYIYRLSYGDNFVTKKMIVLK